MVTTNNVQGDEPFTTAFERQIQTLVVVVKHLTKQNHDLEEQLRQKNVGLSTQEEDQEGTRVERSNQEGLKGSYGPSRLEQQDMSRLSVRHRYGSTSHGHRDTDDEGTDGLYDERPQKTSVQQPR